MRVTKSLLSGISALALAGAAFAGQDSAAVYGSVETSEGEELLSLREEEELILEEERLAALEEREDVMYLYPMES